jgi:hypothetical protein
MLTTMIAFRAAMTRPGEMTRPQRGNEAETTSSPQTQTDSSRR